MGCEEVCRSCKKEIEMKNKTWIPGRKIHCQGENRVIAWAAKDLMQHRISSTLFLIWRQLRFRSLITFLWFLVWTVTVGPDSQRFPTDYTTWEPKALSGASEGRRCMCVGTWERSWISGSCPDSDTWRCPCQCELGSICSPWRPERGSAHRCSGTSLAGVSRAEWLLTKGLALLAGQAVTFCSFPAHTSCTGRAHRTPTAALASAAATGHQAQAWLGPSLLAVTCVYSQLSHPHGHPHCL